MPRTELLKVSLMLSFIELTVALSGFCRFDGEVGTVISIPFDKVFRISPGDVLIFGLNFGTSELRTSKIVLENGSISGMLSSYLSTSLKMKTDDLCFPTSSIKSSSSF
jgi:hypothetical protein